MSVMIKGMEMPKNCMECRFGYVFDCMLTGSFIITNLERNFDCHLVELPEKHGRLIDADELKRKLPKATVIGTDDIEWIIDIEVNTTLEAEE